MLGNNKQLLKPLKMELIIKKYATEITTETSHQEMFTIITNIISDTVNAIDHETIANIAIEGMNKKTRRY